MPSSIAVYAARSAPAIRRAIFHIKSDSAMFDNIAVSSGSGSPDRILAVCGIGLFSWGSHMLSAGRVTFMGNYHAIVLLH
jgi:hypothetical protein